MANNTALGVLGVIVLVAMGVGILVGMQLGGSAGPGTAAPETNGGGGDGGGQTPVPTTGSAVAGTPTLPPEETTVALRRFDNAEIRAEVVRLVNNRRRDAGLNGLVGRRGEAETIREIVDMANGHSETMALRNLVRSEIDGESSADRYREADLYRNCQFESAAGGYIIRPDYPRSGVLEVLGKTVAGRPYEVGNGSRMNANETAVARAVVEEWYGNSAYRDRLSYENARYLGVGIEIDDQGQVYVTGNLC